MASNTNIQFGDLDFNSIKNNLITFLRGQNVLKDYDYSGSALSVLLDILAYNTQYNAFYLNMVANEMFLDSAVQRQSVVSQAKLLGYTPKSAIAPTAFINMNVYNVTSSTLTLPQYTQFVSDAIDSVNYTFVTTDQQTVAVSGNTACFTNIELKQAQPASFTFTVDTTSNPQTIFEIPDPNIDTTTLVVQVQQTSSNASFQVYNQASNFLSLNDTSLVYFLQEGVNGNYQIYFGDGILGAKLVDGNYITVKYLSTQGTAASGANSFTLLNGVGNFAVTNIIPQVSASQGGSKESINSIKFQAPKAFAAQNRAVSKNDYITAIQQNNLGFAFDAVNVWGGEENNPPIFGQVFVCLKPSGSYTLTTAQKQEILTNVIKPISVITVTPTIVDPDYTYVVINVTAYYNPSLTNQTALQIQSGITNAISTFAADTLNTFNSTFNAYDLLTAVQKYDPSIITSEYSISLQKKFFPNLSTATTYDLHFNTPLKRGVFASGVTTTPAIKYLADDGVTVIDGVYLEEVPTQTFGVDTISVQNAGFNYTATPTIQIIGDGSGATAVPIMAGGTIQSVLVTNSGNNYTAAIASVVRDPGDTTGQNASLIVNLQGQFGKLRSYYFNNTNVKTVLNDNVGSIDYVNGIIRLVSFKPVDVDNSLGQFAISATPTTSIISSVFNGIITVDPFDPNAISVNVIAKTNS
jgi:hypothetical protein